MENLPFDRPRRLYKSNMHTHSTNSDDSHSPERVTAFYRDAGYDFLALTDHFMERYGFPITDTRALRSEGFTTLIAAELHAPETRIGETWHIKAISLPLEFPALAPGEAGPEIAARAAEAGAFISIVHPSWYGLTTADAYDLPFAHAIEVYNHGSAVETDRGDDWPFCDQLLNDGWRLSGYATDDAHHLTHDCLGGWVQVKAETPEPDALLSGPQGGPLLFEPGATALVFADEAARFSRAFHNPVAQRIHLIDTAPQFPDAPGRTRWGGAADAALFLDWSRAFNAEVAPNVPLPPRPEVPEPTLFWLVDDEPISVATSQRETASGAAVNMVYTVPAGRGRGYARSVTAAFVEWLLAQGKDKVFLYIDLSNPASNRCYEKIGFRHWCLSHHVAVADA